jgi:hypothetical protein
LLAQHSKSHSCAANPRSRVSFDRAAAGFFASGADPSSQIH